MDDPADEIEPQPGVPEPGLPDSVPTDVPQEPPAETGPPAALLALVGLAVAILAIGLVVWLTNRGDDSVATVDSSTTSTTSTSSLAPATTSTTSTTSTSTTTTSTTTSTTSTSTTVAPTTTVAPFTLPEPGATSWTVTSGFTGPITLDLAATDGDIRVYDGVADQLRCVGVVGPGDALTTWCGDLDVPTAFVADRGLEPVVVELGAEVGAAAIAPQADGWTLASNGCSAPMATILAAVDPGSVSVTGVICAGDEAFVGIGTALFGPEIAPDGGGVLVADGDEGWAQLGNGTSIDCAGWPDGVDRCALFGVDGELFEALLPIPPVPVLGEPSTDVAGVADRSAEVESWIGDTTDPAAIETIVTDQLVDPDAEVVATTRRTDTLLSGGLRLLIVEIPQFDDSVLTETWAIWIDTSDSDTVVTAFSWATCARGVTGDGLCV